MNNTRKPRGAGSHSREARTPFQLELIRLIGEKGGEPGTSGRGLSAKLGKSSNHLWQILNRGMIPSGAAILDIARVLGLSQAEADALVFKAMETKGATRSRDTFWINQAREMVARREAEILQMTAFLEERGLLGAFQSWQGAKAERGVRSRKPGL
jgi:hypothetical protein